jgi:hypothetical protein
VRKKDEFVPGYPGGIREPFLDLRPLPAANQYHDLADQYHDPADQYHASS